MKIRRTGFYAGIRNKETSKDYIKSLALFCALKGTYKSSVIPNYTTDKIHKTTGLHAKTIIKRIDFLIEIGYVEKMPDKDGGVRLILNRVSAKHNNRNIDLNCVVFDSVKTIEKSLYAIYIGEIQRHKEYVKQTIYEAHNSYDLKKLKEAKKRSRGYGDKFVDNGLSYKGIAKRLNCCIQKALSVVSFAVENEFLIKIKRQYQLFCRDARRRFEFGKNDVMNFMFATNNNLYRVLANYYSLGSRLQLPVDIIR